MEFKIKQEKLQEMLEKMILKDVCPSGIFCFKNDSLFSIQKDSHSRALRFLKCNKDYFESFSVEENEEPFEIADMNQCLDLVKKHEPGKTITCYVKDSKFYFKSTKGDEKQGLYYKTSSVPIQDPENVIDKLPLDFDDDGRPFLSAGEDKSVLLDKWFTVELADFRLHVESATPLKTEFYTFLFEDKKVRSRVGDLKISTAGDNVEDLRATIHSGENLEVIFTFGIRQLAQSFTKSKFGVRTNTHSPGWFYEGDKTYKYGVLIPPYTEEQ